MSAVSCYPLGYSPTLSQVFAHSISVVRKVTDLNGEIKIEGRHKWFYAGRELNDNMRARLEPICRRSIAISQDAADEILDDNNAKVLSAKKYAVAMEFVARHIAISPMEAAQRMGDWWNKKGPRFTIKGPWRIRRARILAATKRASFSVK